MNCADDWLAIMLRVFQHLVDLSLKLLGDNAVKGHDQNLIPLYAQPLRMKNPLDTPDQTKRLSGAGASLYPHVFFVGIDKGKDLSTKYAVIPRFIFWSSH